jgi:hypothetical protein
VDELGVVDAGGGRIGAGEVEHRLARVEVSHGRRYTASEGRLDRSLGDALGELVGGELGAEDEPTLVVGGRRRVRIAGFGAERARLVMVPTGRSGRGFRAAAAHCLADVCRVAHVGSSGRVSALDSPDGHGASLGRQRSLMSPRHLSRFDGETPVGQRPR